MRIEIVEKPTDAGPRHGTITQTMWMACLAAHAEGKAVSFDRPAANVQGMLNRTASKNGFYVRTRKVSDVASIAWLEQVQ